MKKMLWRTWRKRLLGIIALVTAVFTLASCSDETTAITYVTPVGLTGVWYTQPGEDLAFIFYEDGRYELYSVVVGEDSSLKESGLYGCSPDDDSKAAQGLSSRIVLGGGAESYESIPISGMFYFIQDAAIDELSYDSHAFHRLLSEPDGSLPARLTEMLVPWDAYIGIWKNDTAEKQTLTITKEWYQLVTYAGEDASAKSGGCIAAYDYLLLPQFEGEALLLELTEEGALRLEGYDGLFWPESSTLDNPS